MRKKGGKEREVRENVMFFSQSRIMGHKIGKVKIGEKKREILAEDVNIIFEWILALKIREGVNIERGEKEGI